MERNKISLIHEHTARLDNPWLTISHLSCDKQNKNNSKLNVEKSERLVLITNSKHK